MVAASSQVESRLNRVDIWWQGKIDATRKTIVGFPNLLAEFNNLQYPSAKVIVGNLPEIKEQFQLVVHCFEDFAKRDSVRRTELYHPPKSPLPIEPINLPPSAPPEIVFEDVETAIAREKERLRQETQRVGLFNIPFGEDHFVAALTADSKITDILNKSWTLITDLKNGDPETEQFLRLFESYIKVRDMVIDLARNLFPGLTMDIGESPSSGISKEPAVDQRPAAAKKSPEVTAQIKANPESELAKIQRTGQIPDWVMQNFDHATPTSVIRTFKKFLTDAQKKGDGAKEKDWLATIEYVVEHLEDFPALKKIVDRNSQK